MIPARMAPVRVSTPASEPSGPVTTATSIGACSRRSNTSRGSVPAGDGDEVGERHVADPGEPVDAGAGRLGDQSDRAVRPVGGVHDDGGAVGALVDQGRGVGHRVLRRQRDRGVGDQVALLTKSTVAATAEIGRSWAARRCRRGARRSRPSGGPPPRSCWPPPPGWWCRSRRRWTDRRRTGMRRRCGWDDEDVVVVRSYGGWWPSRNLIGTAPSHFDLGVVAAPQGVEPLGGSVSMRP